MFRKLILLGALLLVSGACVAQTTAVTATVTDSDSTAWANGTWQLSFQPGPYQSNPAAYTIGGVPLSNSIAYQSGSMNGSGVMNFTAYRSTAISPIGSSWTLQICPNASASCGVLNFSTAAPTQDISTSVNAIILAPRFQAVPGTFGYNDTEAQMQLKTGNMYWNVTNTALRCYTGSAWTSSCSSGGASGFPITLGSTSVAASSTVTTFSGMILVAPALGTPTALTLTNATGLPAASVLSGALVNGMTGTTQSANDNSTKLATTAYVDSKTRAWSCQPGLGDGLNAISAGTYLETTCMNTTGSTITLTGLSCFTDNSGTSTLNASAHTLGALLTGAVTCTSSFAAGTQSANVLLTNGDYVNFTFVSDGTSKQTTWVLKGTY